ncbi:hypothetical protein Lxx06820 [Leifsonia xyli subsp. xyli str. CTCB07]|uniref:DUF2993 domain-containing protein n=1 Tax=Leifsonia xyli subsp. xyli (strain CTCB07) TaxID=281090 RepID=Q6AG80_LEIXX|nr:DUF2993 domain-containing protein [Leifsonia xyli]AAT88615.1 hypothetical protein Lxx06820 [Leifsonia xyli subsp. xyli str. CTCB07]
MWTLVPLAALAILLVATDAIARSVLEQRVAAEIEKSLPETVKADVDVRIGGLSVLQQLLAGQFESVDLLAPRATVAGAPLSFRVHATGVPTDLGVPIASATGTLSVSQDSLNKLVTVPGVTGDLTLQQGAVGYDGRLDLLGLPVGYTVSAKPEAAGKEVLLHPEKDQHLDGDGRCERHTAAPVADRERAFPGVRGAVPAGWRSGARHHGDAGPCDGGAERLALRDGRGVPSQ